MDAPVEQQVVSVKIQSCITKFEDEAKKRNRYVRACVVRGGWCGVSLSLSTTERGHGGSRRGILGAPRYSTIVAGVECCYVLLLAQRRSLPCSIAGALHPLSATHDSTVGIASL